MSKAKQTHEKVTCEGHKILEIHCRVRVILATVQLPHCILNLCLWAGLVLPGLALGQAQFEVRAWTGIDGKKTYAKMLSATWETVTLKLYDGSQKEVPLNSFSEADQEYVASFRAQGLTMDSSNLEFPAVALVDPEDVRVSGGNRNFYTRHFRFETEKKETNSFISEAAEVFEATLFAVGQLPLGIDPQPPEGMDRYYARFLTRETFDVEREKFDTHDVPGQVVAGFYSSAQKTIYVTYGAIAYQTGGGEVRTGGSTFTIRAVDTRTLIHEITHQVMHDWLEITPIWLAEGLAEYVATVPYNEGLFTFKDVEKGLKEKLQSRNGGGLTVRMMHPATLIEGSLNDWGGTLHEYLSSLLLTYYFMHMDRGENGETLRAYMHLIGHSRNQTKEFITNYNEALEDFERKRLVYNKDVETYNADLVTYRKEVADYNARVDQYNQQLRKGIPESQRVVVGQIPQPPTPPEKLKVPEILEKDHGPRVIDLYERSTVKGKPALYQDRSPEQLAAEIRDAYAKIGITVTMDPVKAKGAE